MSLQRRILVAPLNWGLGHATRCIPIIQELLQQKQQVFLASDGRALALLRAEFPDLMTFELPAYNITYRTANMFWNIGWQLPKIVWAIQREKKAVNKIVTNNRIDTIISDNRFGAFTKQTHNIFLTHQLHLKIPFRPFSMVANRCNHYFIRRFDECWIPDFANEAVSLAGTLAHPPLQNMATQYLGVLSRFTKKNRRYPKDTSYLVTPRYDIFILLSGPEPQRTFLEEKLIQQLKTTDLKAIIAQGKTECKENFQLTESIQIVSYLTASEIETVAAQSKIMLCRSGYSTIMDLYELQKNAILIPTPGQTEQEYLAEALDKKGIFYSTTQKNLDMTTASKKAFAYSSFQKENSPNKLPKIINQFLKSK